MDASYKKIDYRLKPAKSVERKMLLETINRLFYFDQLINYKYIGFGSVSFVDFELFHKNLGINKMISIEAKKEEAARFEFNKPYSFIEMRYDISTKVFESLDISTEPVIVWLDYDKNIQRYMFDDIDLVVPQLKSGSMYIITCNTSIDPDPIIKQKDKKVVRLKKFTDDFANYVPIEVVESDLTPKNSHRVLRKMFINRIEEQLSECNKIRDENDKISFQQLFNFIYNDSGATMLTVGGIAYSNNDKEKLEQCCFNNLFYIKNHEEEYKIDIPIVTPKEIQLFNSSICLNQEVCAAREVNSILGNEYEKYKNLDRYFPKYAEI